MGKRIGILVILFSCCFASQAALTLVQRETFQGIGTLDSGTPGNLGTVIAGSFVKLPVGPRITSDTSASSLGWSSDMRASGGDVMKYHMMGVTNTTAANDGMFSCWYRIERLGVIGGNMTGIIESRNYAEQFVRVLVDPVAGHFWYNRAGQYSNQDSGISVPLKEWFELRQTWHFVSGVTYDFTCNFRAAGSTEWTNILSGQFALDAVIQLVWAGMPNQAESAGFVVGRYGMPSLYATSSYAVDSTNLVADVVDPSGNATTWYFNSTTGSDTNDGTTDLTPWLTTTNFNAQSLYAGFMTGDTVIVDTAGGLWDATVQPLAIKTDGITLRSPNTGVDYIRVKSWITIPPGEWEQTASLTKVFQTTNSASLACLWENDKWMNHPNGSTFSSVSNSLQTIAGSFWSDGTVLYAHPFGDSDPRVDGKTYDRPSYPGTTVVSLTASGLTIKDLFLRKNCDVAATTGSPNGGYLIGSGTGFAGTNLLFHCYGDYGGKHAFGFVASATNSLLVIDGCQAEQGSPYGSQSPFVSFMSAATDLGNIHIYTNCTSIRGAGVIGSTNGTGDDVEVFLDHNSSSGQQFDRIDILNCNFSHGTIASGSAQKQFRVIGGVCGAIIVGLTNVSAAQTLIDYSSPAMPYSGCNISLLNCILKPVKGFQGGQFTGFSAQGIASLSGCTLDLSSIPSTDAEDRAMIDRIGSLTLSLSNCVFIAGTAHQFTLIGNATDADTLTFNRNVYWLGSSTLIANGYSVGGIPANRTFAQWQSLGFDAHSVNANPCLGPGYRPYTKTPCWTVGAELGPATDFTGKVFQSRRTAGAYEYVTPQPTLLMFGQ